MRLHASLPTVSIIDLYQESGWETLSQRRRKHKLILFYKMANRLTPNYLNTLVPSTVGNSCRYKLCRPNNLRKLFVEPTCTALHFYHQWLMIGIH